MSVDPNDAANKTYVDNVIQTKADLNIGVEQTFNSIVNVPNFDPGYSNLSNVMNKKYIDSQDLIKADKTYLDVNFLNRKTGGTIENMIQFDHSKPNNQRQIHNLGQPQYNSSAASKAYVDSTVQYIFEDDEVMALDGRNPMEAALDMGTHRIINLRTPVDDTDAVNKGYLHDNIGGTYIHTVGSENIFRYLKNDAKNQLSEEDDIEYGDIVNHQSPYHRINKKTLDAKLLLDSAKGYYSSRLRLNMYPLSLGYYTLAFEIYYPVEIDDNSISISAVS